MKRPRSEIEARLGFEIKRGSLPAWLPFAILFLAAVILLLFWDSIPERWVTHWAFDGRPDGWTSKSPLGVFLPLAVGALLCVFLEALARSIANRTTAGEGFNLSEEAVAVMAEATAYLLRLTNVSMASLMAVVAVALPLYQPRSPMFVVVCAILFVALPIVPGLARYRRDFRALKERGLLGGAEGWNGFFYSNPRDSRLWVPKPFGYGYTINFAHPWAWPMFLFILAVPVTIVIPVLVLAS
ncbi:MAG TPA: DUF5808 domain-containing protein [Blastocatellia bacterium]|nr:DUF5808 domain-containing protein [Blastocatellia bacterium]